jgi:hypothetical protein
MAEQALARLRDRVLALAQAVAAADPPPFPVAGPKMMLSHLPGRR